MTWLANHVGGVQITLMIAVIALGLCAALSLLRWFVGKSCGADLGTIAGRRNQFFIFGGFAILALVSWALAPKFLETFRFNEPPAPVCICTVQCTSEAINVDCEVCAAEGADLTALCSAAAPSDTDEPNYEEGYLLPVSLTEDQIADFLNKVDLTFTKRSLGGDNRTARNAAVAVYAAEHNHTPFQDPVNYPIVEWFPEFEQLRDSKLTLDQRLELTEKFFDALDQEMVSNIPFTIMILDNMKKLPYVYKYNSEWIDGNLVILNQMYDGTYQQPADAASSDIELAKIPTLDSKYKGLDYLVVSDPNGLGYERLAREEWARLCARMSSALRTYAFRSSGAMVVSRTADLSWHNPIVAEDSLVRMVIDDKNDNRDWLMLSVMSKQIDAEDKLDAEYSLIGINPEDSRFGIFTPNTPDPKPEEPKPEDPPTTPTTPVTPKTYSVSTVSKDTNGNILVPQAVYKSGLKNGASCTVSLPSTPNGYTLKRVVVGSTDKALSDVTVTINKANVLVTFIYEKNPEVKVVDYALTSDHGYYDSRNKWQSFGTRAEGRYTAGARYSVNADYKVPSGYYAVQKTVTGDMPAKDHTVRVEYKQVVTYTLTIKYVYSGGGRAAPTYTGEYEYDESYYVPSPDIKGYTPDISVVKGEMPNRDKTVTVTYKKDNIPFDGEGTKNPGSSSNNTGDAPNGGGNNQTTNGEGDKQDTKPPETDYPPAQSGGNNGNGGGGSNPPISANDPNEDSSGLGGSDHQIQNPNNGNTQGGDPPATDPIPTVPGTSGTNQETNKTETPAEKPPENVPVNPGW